MLLMIKNKNLSQKKLFSNEDDLLACCYLLEGLSFAQLATQLQIPLPTKLMKGWLGMVMEQALGAYGSNKQVPDFKNLNIELKTLPLCNNKPSESTFITSISLINICEEIWENSKCFHKLKKILWVPIEGAGNIHFAARRIGRAFLWSPNQTELNLLKKDWEELVFLIISGNLAKINAKIGRFLHIRPKAASGASLCHGFDNHGNKILTLPRGFYLRSNFTAKIFQQNFQQN